MDFFKINLLFYHSYWLRLLLVVCGDIDSYLGPGFDSSVRVIYSNIRGLHANLDELAMAGSDYYVIMFWFVLSLKSLIAAISQSCVSLSFGCPQQRLRNSTHGA